ncbi:hypothetical protein [Kitasatospora camelliae]|uniref:Uncharacterized protein n=1 Tax=Kitasatospora camelliae TaxID=3156397 RepID=A0AAU8JS25_9ACTN
MMETTERRGWNGPGGREQEWARPGGPYAAGLGAAAPASRPETYRSAPAGAAGTEPTDAELYAVLGED